MRYIIEVAILFIILYLKDLVVNKLKTTENSKMKVFLKAVIVISVLIMTAVGVLIPLAALWNFQTGDQKSFIILLITAVFYIPGMIFAAYKSYRLLKN